MEEMENGAMPAGQPAQESTQGAACEAGAAQGAQGAAAPAWEDTPPLGGGELKQITEAANRAQDGRPHGGADTPAHGAQGEGIPGGKPPVPNEVWKTARLRAEREAAARYGRLAAQQDAEAAAHSGGLRMPDGQPVRSVKDLFAALDAQAAAHRQEAAARAAGAGMPAPSDMGMPAPEAMGAPAPAPAAGTPGAVAVPGAQAAEQAPVVQRAMQLVQRAQRSEGERVLNSQIRRISELDPAVKTLADIAGMDTFPQFDALVRSGVPLDVAYKAVNFERLARGKAAAARQAAINAARGKGHLAPAGGAGPAPGGLTEEEYAEWANFGISRKEAEQYAKKYRR